MGAAARVVTKNILEGVFFILVVIILFNTITDFALKIGITSRQLTTQDIQNFGFLSYFLGVLNFLSGKFFGFSLER